MRVNARTYVGVLALCALLSLAVRVSAATISGVTVSGLSTSTATVQWSTDTNTDATIHYGLDTSVGIVRDSSFSNTAHTLTITGLQPATTYHFQVESTDAQGNTSATAGLVFTTGGSAAARINNQIKQLTNPKDIVQVVQQVEETAQTVLRPPSINGLPRVEPDTNGATITWQTDREAGSQVLLAPAQGFTGSYTITQGNANDSSTDHTVHVVGLQASTQYHFEVSSSDNAGLTGTSKDDVFTTKSIIPKIQSARVANISDTNATVIWNTGSVLARGNVDFTNNRNKKKLSMGDPAFLTQHKVELTGLSLGTKYTILIHATNQGGDDVVSQPITFTTVKDTIPPVIAKVKNESTLFPSDDVKIQTILSWITDEPASCQVFYTQGVAQTGAAGVQTVPLEANPLTGHTTVIVGLTPSSVYSFWMTCKDVSGNVAQSDNYVLLTPTKEKNIIDLILQNFQGTFGWVNNIGK